jgi:hypothetical protein
LALLPNGSPGSWVYGNFHRVLVVESFLLASFDTVDDFPAVAGHFLLASFDAVDDFLAMAAEYSSVDAVAVDAATAELNFLLALLCAEDSLAGVVEYVLLASFDYVDDFPAVAVEYVLLASFDYVDDFPAVAVEYFLLASFDAAVPLAGIVNIPVDVNCSKLHDMNCLNLHVDFDTAEIVAVEVLLVED